MWQYSFGPAVALAAANTADCPETNRPEKKYVVDLNVSLQICV